MSCIVVETMKIEYADEELEQLRTSNLDGKYRVEIVNGFRKVVNFIEQAVSEQDFRAMRSLNYEKLKGNRSHEHSFRINRQWRLIVEVQSDKEPTVILCKEIEDYHH